MVMISWASKLATAKIECSLEMGKWGTIYFAGDGTMFSFFDSKVGSFLQSSIPALMRPVFCFLAFQIRLYPSSLMHPDSSRVFARKML